VDDAVAKLDGYIISIAGAARNVGEKRMVRIETVGRTAANALLLDESGEAIRPAPRPAARPAAKRPRRRSKTVARASTGESRTGEQEQTDLGDGAAPPQSAQESPPEPEQEPVASGSQADAQESADAGGEDDLQSKPRRRGRRGGRRRSAAKAPATSE
jgi:ribonuclease G